MFGRRQNKVLNSVKKTDKLVNYKAKNIVSKSTLNKTTLRSDKRFVIRGVQRA